MTSQNNLSSFGSSRQYNTFSSRTGSLQIDRTIHELKVILLGDVAVGKTAMFNRFVDNTFIDEYVSNIGVAFKVKIIYLNETTGAELKIWDTCGEEKFRSLTRQYYHDTHGAILMFDLTDKKTFLSTQTWYKDLRENGPRGTTIVLVGNKSDLVDNRAVTFEEAEAFAKSHHLQYLEVSAKTGDNIELVFDKLAYACVENAIRGSNQNDELEVKSRTEKSGMMNNLGSSNNIPKKVLEKQKDKEVGCC